MLRRAVLHCHDFGAALSGCDLEHMPVAGRRMDEKIEVFARQALQPAGQVILKEYDDVFHVKVIAPANLRAKRISNSQRISYQTAQAQIETSDRARKNYLLRYYNARWDDPELYDMIINTDRIDPEQAAYLVCQAIAQCFQ